MLLNARKNMHGILVLALLTQVSGLSFASNKTKSSVYLGISRPTMNVAVDDEGTLNKGEKTHRIVYQPRIPTIALIGASWDIFSASISKDIQSSDEQSVEYTDYRFFFFYPWFGLSATYTEFVRFRISEIEGFSTELEPEEQFKKDMAAEFISANFYLFPIRWGFDFGSAFDPDESKSSGIGIGFVGSWNKTEVDTQQGLIPERFQRVFGADSEFTRGKLEGTNIQGAVGVTLAGKGFYASGLLAVGPGKQAFSYSSGNEQRTGSGQLQKINRNISLGYSGKSFFSAIEMNEESPTYILKFISLSPTRTEINFVAGIKW